MSIQCSLVVAVLFRFECYCLFFACFPLVAIALQTTHRHILTQLHRDSPNKWKEFAHVQSHIHRYYWFEMQINRLDRCTYTERQMNLVKKKHIPHIHTKQQEDRCNIIYSFISMGLSIACDLNILAFRYVCTYIGKVQLTLHSSDKAFVCE